MVASAEGTQRYRASRAREGVAPAHFREREGLWLSSIGLGTYLGPHDDRTDDLYREAVVAAVELGCNVVDTSINYRFQRSERAVGRALDELAARGFARDEIFVSTKVGFVPFDGGPPADPDRYLQQTFYATGILKPSDVVARCHALAPAYIEHQLDQSRKNLGLETIDLYYLHNPEMQLAEIDRERLEERLVAAFEVLEKAAGEGKIQFYGTATWGAYRQPPGARDHLSLEWMVSLARRAGGEGHRFRFIQLPYSLAMPEAFTSRNQTVRGEEMSALQAAEALGLTVMSSASIAQGQLTRGLPEWLGKLLRGMETDAQRSIQFARSSPGLATALVGMKTRAHVEENLAVAKVPPTPLEDFMKLFEVDRRE